MKNYDDRQFSLMLDKLDAFEKRAISLSALISSLTALLASLQGDDEHWKNAFLKQCGVLEDVNANALDQGFPTIPSEHRLLVDKATGELRRLIAREL